MENRSGSAQRLALERGYADHRIARAEPGLRLGEFDRATQAYGLATTLGIASDTGIAGLTLGGGIGWLNGTFGLACDNVRSFEVVTAEGQVLTVDCYPASNVTLARRQREAWKSHLMESYSEAEANNYLEAWSHEDVYVPLDAEMELMHRAGLAAEVLWRKDAFAVLQGKR